MKCSMDVHSLKAALALLMNVVERKNTIPVLATIRFDVGGGKLRLTGTDLDNYLTVELDAESAMPGCVCLPARQVREISDAVASGSINLECEDSTARLFQGVLSYKLWTLSGDTFPEIPDFAPTPITAGSAQIQALISHTIFSITQEEGRYTLSGAKVLIDKEGAVFITTDGHRLSLARVNEFVSDNPVDVLIPRRALNVISDLSRIADVVMLGFDDERVYVRAGNVELNARLLRGQFPKWEQVLPKTFARTVQVESEEFVKALSRVMIMADSRSRYMHMTLGDTTAEISAEDDSESTSAQTSFPVVNDGDPITLAFNGNYLRQVVSVRKGPVALAINDSTSQIGVRLLGDSILDDYQHVLMPCR